MLIKDTLQSLSRFDQSQNRPKSKQNKGKRLQEVSLWPQFFLENKQEWVCVRVAQHYFFHWFGLVIFGWVWFDVVKFDFGGLKPPSDSFTFMSNFALIQTFRDFAMFPYFFFTAFLRPFFPYVTLYPLPL